MKDEEKDYIHDVIEAKVEKFRKPISKLRSKRQAAQAMAKQVILSWFDSDDVCECDCCETGRALVLKEILTIKNRKSAKIN